jgi:hypothetical protein
MPRSFLAQQHALQLKILPRLQSLGIIAVLPAFAGFVVRERTQTRHIPFSSPQSWF